MKSILIISTALFIWGAIHSIFAANKIKTIFEQLGKKLYNFYRITYNVFSFISFIPIVYLVMVLKDRLIYTIPYPWILISSSFQIVAVFLMIVGFRQSGIIKFLGLDFFNKRDSNKNDQMITKGLYRIVRHPLYFLGLVVVWLNPFMTINRMTLSVGLTIYVVIGAFFEEKRLEKYFGDDYRNYKSRTPMLIPGIQIKSKSNH
jgi:methanethiol S-methyltransferase